MQDVAIIGAGELGGALAHVLARRDIAARDPADRRRRARGRGKALDIMQAAPIEGFATAVSGSTDLSPAAGAAVVVVADRVGGAEWQGEDGLLLLKRLPQLRRAQRRDRLRRRLAARAGRARRPRTARRAARLFGSAPEALAGGARALVALEIDGSPRDVALTVLGVPPAHIVIPWEDATLAGFALTRRARRAGATAARGPGRARCGRPGRTRSRRPQRKAVGAMLGRSRRRRQLLRGAG